MLTALGYSLITLPFILVIGCLLRFESPRFVAVVVAGTVMIAGCVVLGAYLIDIDPERLPCETTAEMGSTSEVAQN